MHRINKINIQTLIYSHFQNKFDMGVPQQKGQELPRNRNSQIAASIEQFPKMGISFKALCCVKSVTIFS